MPERKDKKFLGFWKQIIDNKYEEKYTWLTNQEAIQKAEQIGSGLLLNNFCPLQNDWRNFELKMFGIYSQTSLEFVLCEIAAILYGLTTVPIYDTLGEEAMIYIFNQTKMETLFLSQKHVEKICKIKQEKNELNFLKNLIIMDTQ